MQDNTQIEDKKRKSKQWKVDYRSWKVKEKQNKKQFNILLKNRFTALNDISVVEEERENIDGNSNEQVERNWKV